jgi:hypothetical protein
MCILKHSLEYHITLETHQGSVMYYNNNKTKAEIQQFLNDRLAKLKTENRKC